MPFFSHVATAIPEHQVDAESMKAVSLQWLQDDLSGQEKFLRISSQSGVSSRQFVLPYEEILSLHGLQSRAEQFEEKGTALLTEAVVKALAVNSQDPKEIGALVFTSCSMPSIPSIDASAILQTEIPNNVARVPIYQHGCAGGVIGLALGSRLANLGKPVVVASTELCSLVFQPRNQSGAHLVGAAIFADGAAATVISPHSGTLGVRDAESHLLPNSRHLMGYDIFDDGFHLRLDRALPTTLIQHAPGVVERFLERNGKTKEDINYWLFHPGGIKILHFLQETFSLTREQCTWSFDVLRKHGNLSSATILYVINAFLQEVQPEPGESVLVMGIGPGLTIELVLLEHSPQR